MNRSSEMAEISLSSAVRQNLLSLQSTAELMSKTQNRLSTGLKVNSALDDPTAFFTAQSLNSRAGDLSRLLDSVGNAVQTVKAADDGISAITKLVESAQATARQALQKPAGSTTATVNTGSAVTGMTGTTTLDSLGFSNGETITVTTDENGTSTTTTYTIADATTEDVDAVMTALAANSGIATMTIASNQITTTAINAKQSITFGGTGDVTQLGLTTTTTESGYNFERETLETEFNNLRAQIDQLAADASFNGINLLNGDSLSVIFNEDGSSSLSLTGVTFNSSGLGINAAAADSFQTNSNINTVLDELGSAISKLRSQGATFGSNLSVIEVRQDFTKNLINTLETGAAGLTLADVNEEGANMLALQTRQQLSSVAMSMASQADQNVLRLFR